MSQMRHPYGAIFMQGAKVLTAVVTYQLQDQVGLQAPRRFADNVQYITFNLFD